MRERDERTLDQVRFALGAPNREQVEASIRSVLWRAGVVVAQDIIDLGCTGLFKAMRDAVLAPEPLPVTINVRENMAGSICGLPCYVPRERFCLVHNTIGGLQEAGNTDGPQAPRFQEVLPDMSRELTEEERKRKLGVEAKINEDARAKALAEYGAEDLLSEDAATLTEAERAYVGASIRDLAGPASCPVPQPPFKCLDHTEPDWTCRKCLAQVLVEEAAEVQWFTRLVDADGVHLNTVATVEEAISKIGYRVEPPVGVVNRVELWIRVASWSKKVARD